MKVLVTGGAGFLGKHLEFYLVTGLLFFNAVLGRVCVIPFSRRRARSSLSRRSMVEALMCDNFL